MFKHSYYHIPINPKFGMLIHQMGSPSLMFCFRVTVTLTPALEKNKKQKTRHYYLVIIAHRQA